MSNLKDQIIEGATKILESAKWAFRAYGNQNGFKDQNKYAEDEVEKIKDFLLVALQSVKEEGRKEGVKEISGACLEDMNKWRERHFDEFKSSLLEELEKMKAPTLLCQDGVTLDWMQIKAYELALSDLQEFINKKYV